MINTRVPSSLLVTRLAKDLVNKQNTLAEVQEQISTGKKINRPSDAPAEAAHLLTMDETVTRLNQYTKNSSIAESQLALEEGALAGTTMALTRIYELGLGANTGLVNDGFREEISSELKLKLAELFSLANARDSFGNFLFSGSNIDQQPFNPGSAGSPVAYSGSDDTTHMELALGRTISTGDTGLDVFMRIRSGNGDFTTSSDQTNTGTGSINLGAISDATIFQGVNYDISFTSPTSYDVVNVATGTTIQTGQVYKSGGKIEFDGMMTRINGEPQAGDTFRIEPSPYKDIFSSVSDMINALEENPMTEADTARVQAKIDRSIIEVDNALNHINTVRAKVGTRLGSIDSSRQENENVALQIERTKSSVEDVDIVDAVTRLQTQANSLEILQKSFSRIEGLSLFNYM